MWLIIRDKRAWGVGREKKVGPRPPSMTEVGLRHSAVPLIAAARQMTIIQTQASVVCPPPQLLSPPLFATCVPSFSWLSGWDFPIVMVLVDWLGSP